MTEEHRHQILTAYPPFKCGYCSMVWDVDRDRWIEPRPGRKQPQESGS